MEAVSLGIEMEGSFLKRGLDFIVPASDTEFVRLVEDINSQENLHKKMLEKKFRELAGGEEG